VREQIHLVRERTQRPFGVGFISSFPQIDEVVQVAIEERVPAISHSFADPTPYVPAAHEAGIKVLAQVQKVSHAKKVALAGVDVITAQGTEAGGHTGNSGTLPLVPAVIDVVGDIPVVAAGGIADGRGMAAMLMLGAEGVWLGTRFVVSREARHSDWQKQRAVEASTDDTVLTKAWDITYDYPFPRDISARILSNDFTAEWHGRDEEIVAHREEIKEKLAAAQEAGDANIAVVWVGNATGLISSVEPAADIVHRIIEEAEAILRNRPQTLLKD
jgi:nitronate monooxygenase